MPYRVLSSAFLKTKGGVRQEIALRPGWMCTALMSKNTASCYLATTAARIRAKEAPPAGAREVHTGSVPEGTILPRVSL